MKLAVRFSVLVTVSLLCVSCERAAIEPSQSLVGATKLPSANALSRETLYIVRDGDTWPLERLSYEWRPDDSLTVTHSVLDRKAPRPVVKGEEILRLSPEVAAQARRLLWRVRPANLEGVEWLTRPTGCVQRGPHDFGDITVGFIAEGPKPGVEDDRVGIFDLPYPESFYNRQAVEARKVVHGALQLFPPSKVAAGFEQSLKQP
jgi:hypothetical protein